MSQLGLILMSHWAYHDEGLRIASVCIQYIVAYFPYLLTLLISQNLLPDKRLERLSLGLAIAMRVAAIGPAVLTSDMERYRWEASALDRGFNPYRTTPASLGEFTVPGADFSAVYGPWLEFVHWVAYRLTGGQWMQLSAVLAECCVLGLLWRRLGQGRLPFFRWLLYAWCPLVMYEFWQNGHNDAWLVLGLFLMLEEKSTARSWLWLGASVLTKWWTLLLVPLWVRRAGWRWGALVLCGVGAMLALLLTPAEWVTKVRFTTGFLGGWTNNAFLYHLLTQKEQAVALFVVAGIALPFWRQSPAKVLLAFPTLLLSFSANIHLWYLSWLLPGLVLTEVNPLPWILPMALLPLSYDSMLGWVLAGVWRENQSLRFLIWIPVLVHSSAHLLMRRTR